GRGGRACAAVRRRRVRRAGRARPDPAPDRSRRRSAGARAGRPPGRRGGRRHVGRLGALGAGVPVLCQLAAQAPALADARGGGTAGRGGHGPPSHAGAGAGRARRRGPPRRPGAAFRAAARGEVASLVDREDVTRPPLLLYLASAGDPQRFAIAPALAALAERRGWEFELYYAAYRAGRHFGGGPPGEAAPGWPARRLAAGRPAADPARPPAERC